MEPILHLSLPVTDLPATTAFYVDVLGCPAGRSDEHAADVWFLGLQLTLQNRPEQVLAEQGVRHFGATLDREGFTQLCTRVEQAGVAWLRAPATRLEGTPQEERKAYLTDPAGNLIELKSYARPEDTLWAAGSYA